MKTIHPASAFATLGCALIVALAAPSASHARTVYDAGAALYANCTAASGAPILCDISPAKLVKAYIWPTAIDNSIDGRIP